MAVRGDESGDDPVIVGVVDGCCVEAGGGVAGGYGLEGSVTRHDEITVEGSALRVRHGEDVGVADYELCGGLGLSLEREGQGEKKRAEKQGFLRHTSCYAEFVRNYKEIRRIVEDLQECAGGVEWFEVHSRSPE
jgi:hypothetical protein